MRAFKDDRLALRQSAIQQERRIADKGPHLFGGVRVFAKHFVGIERFGIEQRMRNRVFLAARILDVRAQQLRVEQVGDAQSAASHLVFV